MTTFTDKELIKEIKERIGSLDVRDNIERRAYEIALASLEADPVAYIFKHPAGKLFWALTDESNKEQSDVIPVYAAPPVPVVPEEKPMPNPLKMYAVDAVAAIAEVRGWNACRAAMLHGAEPVSQTYKSQHTQFEQVADLYEMQFDDGRTCAFHTDAQKAAQWLQACDGNRVQEYVKLERLRNALSGNYPVTPDGWISCSDLMPDSKTAVLVAREFDRKGDWRMKWATYIPGHPDANDGWIIPGASWIPSHWMQLPEPPQEVNRG
ncbi:DUF551 domain-containing protein [Escherichia fergusonii]|nr:DUF551 domain-containing protein [Escherichia fergusonii]